LTELRPVGIDVSGLKLET